MATTRRTPTRPRRQEGTLIAGNVQRIIQRSVDKLLLDPSNPRLALDSKPPTQDALLATLAAPGDLDELANSFARNGYFWEEPLVVVPNQKGMFVVVEGNRRLAALKLLLNPNLRRKVRPANFPELSRERMAQLANVPTVTYRSRHDVIPYLGFRHITGVKKWEPFAKARYVATLVESGAQISEIEQTVGDSASTVKKLYQQFAIYRQIRDDLDTDIDGIRDAFSLLEVVLGQQPIKTALGLPRSLPSSPVERLVSDDKLGILQDVVSWVFGNRLKREERVISESRDISQRLAPVIAEPRAYEYLKRTRDLEGAYEHSGGEQQFLLKQLIKASRAVERALGLIPLYKDDDEILEEVKRLRLLIESL